MKPFNEKEAIEELRGMVYDMAWKYEGHGVPFEDLVQSGYEGVLIAYNHYKEGTGAKFSTYAYYWILKTVYRAVNEEGRAVRIPEWFRDRKLVPVIKVKDDLYQELNREPTNDELADALGWIVEDVEEALGWGLFEPATLDDDEYEIEIEDTMPGPKEALDTALRGGAVKDALSLLSQRHLKVLKMRFGLTDRYYTLREVGDELNISQTRAMQMEREALDILRNHPNARRLLGGWLENSP